MVDLWPSSEFIFGSVFTLFLVWIGHRLASKEGKDKERWVRVLNSYQDFYQNTTQLIDLLKLEHSVTESVFWQLILSARKTAYDIDFLGESTSGDLERAGKMKCSVA